MDMMTYWENERRKLLGLPLIADTGKSGTALDAPDSAVKKQAGEEEEFAPQPLTPEETKHKNKPIKGAYSQDFKAEIALFKKALNSSNSVEAIEAALINAGKKIWSLAVESQNDSALYLSRIQISALLRQNFEIISQKKPALNKSKINYWTELLEAHSRNFVNVVFSSNVKKILLTGFDPFEEEDTNFSGELILRFHNKTIQSGNKQALIQCAIFPVRYEDFDSNIVERFFQKWLYGTDALVSCSLDDSDFFFSVDRFAANYRNSEDPDNNDAVKPSGVIKNSAPNFYETGLSFSKFPNLFDSIPITTTNIRYREDYKTESTSVRNKRGVLPPSEQMKEGSGGDFLSNEIFYRVSHMKPPIPYGHIHVPWHATDAHVSMFGIILSRLLEVLE